MSAATAPHPGTRRLLLGAGAGALASAVALPTRGIAAPGAPRTLPPVSLAERTGSIFLPAPRRLVAPPRVQRVQLPQVEQANAIWGATGRDPRGQLWFGVSVASARGSAHLLNYAPRTGSWRVAGSVTGELARLGLLRPGESQVKIHSRIVTGEDGWIYFTSSDEDGEREDGSALPRWGGHLWRTRADDPHWEHLAAVPEALIAAGAAGPFIDALGYWGHVLYRFDTRRGTLTRVAVGSVGGHASRNFLSTPAGHAFVPRVWRAPDGRLQAALVEFDAQLRELAATPLMHYLGGERPETSHGITALATLPDGRIAFTTSLGQLYLITPAPNAPASVQALGWFHPDGEAYASGLFAYGGGNLLAGVCRRRGAGFDWVVYELLTRSALALPLDTTSARGVLLYGSQTRDDEGACYLAGWASEGQGTQRPLLLRVLPDA